MITATRALSLRPYQEQALEAINAAYSEEEINRPLVALPTGTGKTVIFAHLLARRVAPALILAHRDELIRQSVDKLLMVNPDFEIGVVKAQENQVYAPVVVASVQTLSRPNRLEQLSQSFRSIIVDEAHHAVAESYRRILEHVGAFDPDGPLTVGFTATPERGDRAGLGQVWQKIVFQKHIQGMILDGYLCDLRALRVSVSLNLDDIHVRHGDFVDSELSEALSLANAPDLVVAAYQEHAPQRKALLFTPTVQLAYDMAAAFQGAGIAAEALDGTTDIDERRGILKRLHSGETRVVCNCAVLTEGFDEPSIDCIIIARPTKSKPLYIQMIGRGTRLYPGKDDLLVLDVVGASTRHRLVTASEIFNLDLQEKSVKQAVAAKELAEGIESGQYVYTPDGDLVAVPVDLFRTRPLHWQQTRMGAWVLPLGKSMLRLVPVGADRWDVEKVIAGVRTTIWADLPLSYAMGCAEDYAREQGNKVLMDPAAPWRSDLASEKQIAALRRWNISIAPGLTKGQASDLLAALWGDR